MQNMYLKRKIDDQLNRWKNNSEKLPLILTGARQIGKSSSVEHFAKTNYRNVIEINFIDHPEFRKITENGYSVDAVTKLISLLQPSVRFIPGETLIFFDEVQEFPDITTTLKFFAQDGRFDVICSGSLLGVHYKLVSSISVGYTEEIRMNAMDFEEFLWAKGYGNEAVEDMLSHMRDNAPFSSVENDVYSSLFFDFCITGGLPKAVSSYITKGNFENVARIQKNLIADYRKDILKYHEEVDQARILQVFEHIPVFLSRENKKFTPSVIRSKGTIDEFIPSVRWLEDAGLVVPAYNLTIPEIPLSGNYDADKFKLYFFDTGLLLSMLEKESQADFRANRNFGIYKGGLFENIIGEAVFKSGRDLFYYKKDNSTLEEDFFLRTRSRVVPVEVKASNNNSKTLRTLIESRSYREIEFGVRLISGNIGFTGSIYTFPHYTAFLLSRFLEEME